MPRQLSNERYFSICTFTLHFDLPEDRVRIEALDKAGEQQSLFLTRRLANRLIGVLIARLDDEAAAIAEGTGDKANASLAVRRQSVCEVVQSMAQERVRIARSEVGALPAPVLARSEAPRWLCRTIRFSGTATGTVLELTDDAEHCVRLLMNTADIRAVLDGFMAIYRQAEWDLQAFPEWLTESAPAVQATPRLLN